MLPSAVSPSTVLICLVVGARHSSQLMHTNEKPRRALSCGVSADWNSTVQAWDSAGTDQHLSEWWSRTLESDPSADLTNQLARQFGEGYTDYSCSILDSQSCIIPGCQAYVDAQSPIWSYLALEAIVNMNIFLNRVWQGIETGETRFEGKASAIAQTFFPWHDPRVQASQAAFWVDATVGAMFGSLSPATRIAKGVSTAVVTFANAGSQTAQLDLTPNPDLTLQQGIGVISTAVAQAANKSQNHLESWANTLVSGAQDQIGNTIIDYLRGGSFITSVGPSNEETSQFWEDSMTSRIINSQWITRPNFVTFARTQNESTDIGPDISKYYSKAAGGVYYLYQWKGGWKKGHLGMPDGMMQLSSATYDIPPKAVTESSARAFEAAKFNYTNKIALDDLQKSLLNTTSSPILDGAGWTGLWTIPVCDMGGRLEWNGQYNHSHMAPCCCGKDCKDTKKFVELANLKGRQSYLQQCRKQLKGTDLDFNKIDYGFKSKLLTTAMIVGVVVSAVFIVALSCCCWCLDDV